MTQDVHYELFRKADLLKRGNRDSSLYPEDLAALEADIPSNKASTMKRRKTKKEAAAKAVESGAV